jgi:hypothetical protein
MLKFKVRRFVNYIVALVSSVASAGSRSVRFWDNMGAALVKGAIFGD